MNVLKQIKKNTSNNRGFGLIEILVSVGIFAIIATMGITALLGMIDAGEKSQAFNSVMQNLNVALETMARDIRTGTNYSCSQTFGAADGAECVTSGNSTIQFIPSTAASDNDRTMYTFSGDQIRVQRPGDAAPMPVTASEVFISDIRFYVMNATNADAQPRVLLSVAGYVQTRQKNRVSFTLQTTMTQRIIQDVQEQ